MENQTLKIKSIEHTTHDVLRIVTDKPAGIEFLPGQAANMSINKSGWQNVERPFTFANLPTDDYLEFFIKTYPEKGGVTAELLELLVNDELILHAIFGTILYKGEGVFIAGGAGVTPFISIFRNLKAKNEVGHNKLIFANKRKRDIILKLEFTELLGDNFINMLSDEQFDGYHFGWIDENFLKATISDFKQHFYLCGPPPMMKDVEKYLLNLGAHESHITKEIF